MQNLVEEIGQLQADSREQVHNITYMAYCLF